MNQKEKDKLTEIAYGPERGGMSSLRNYLDTVTIEEKPDGNYTGAQRNSAWLYMTHKVQQLNDAGLEMRKILKPTYSIPWTKDSFHDHVWIPIQKALYGTDSMKSLKKLQVSKIHEVIEREMSEKHGVEYIPFPSDEKKAEENMSGVKLAQHNNLSNPDYEDMDESTSANKF